MSTSGEGMSQSGCNLWLRKPLGKNLYLGRYYFEFVLLLMISHKNLFLATVGGKMLGGSFVSGVQMFYTSITVFTGLP